MNARERVRKKKICLYVLSFIVIRFVWHFAIKRHAGRKKSSKRTKKKEKKRCSNLNSFDEYRTNMYAQSTFHTYRFIALVQFIYLFKRKSLPSSFLSQIFSTKTNLFFFLVLSFFCV
jgi:hypothetical protein